MNSKHKLIAIFVAPVLAFGGYVITDLISSKDATNIIQLSVPQDCKPMYSRCEVRHADLGVDIVVTKMSQQRYRLHIIASSALGGVLANITTTKSNKPPIKLESKTPTQFIGQFSFSNQDLLNDNKVMLVLSQRTKTFIVEIPIKFS